ncbi:hypothetical protein A9179_11640 [Pseudomonas alcaligenes]|uniref:MAPEG family protein n=1 Tax=Aquipseudomonas alcaligenes TaxID=43263 RepID=A0ABR7S018_AQUAC|nr:MAPEG family protein [Pseudomonas alcaligenes]MBC9250931.1 hypothetical protein [Pseudomonas alcaligenes]
MTGIMAVLGFALWTLLLVVISTNWRVLEMLRGKAANSWIRGQDIPKPDVIVRIEHAHLNCLENLPVFAVLVFAAYFQSKSAVVDGLGFYVLYARVAQSLTHLVGTSHVLVLVRGTFYTMQLAMFFYLFWGLMA